MKMRLKNWQVKSLYRWIYVVGYIYNDEKGRFEDGTLITTSAVKRIDFENKVVETLNSTYYLD